MSEKEKLMSMAKKNNKSFGRKVLNYAGTVGLSLLSASFMISSANALDAVEASSTVIGSEGGKAAINEALKIAKSKPSFALATAIVCVGCIPAVGMAASPATCIACGILIAKTLG